VVSANFRSMKGRRRRTRRKDRVRHRGLECRRGECSRRTGDRACRRGCDACGP
jgi:hypothetical protein